MGAPRVTPEEVKRFFELYELYGSFKRVAEETNRSASTVAKYIKAHNLRPLRMACAQEFPNR